MSRNFMLQRLLTLGRKTKVSTLDLTVKAKEFEDKASESGTDASIIGFLSEARKIYLKLGKKEDVKRIVRNAKDIQERYFRNPVSESRFLDFEISSYRKIGEKQLAGSLRRRAKKVRNYLSGCLVFGVEPGYTRLEGYF